MHSAPAIIGQYINSLKYKENKIQCTSKQYISKHLANLIILDNVYASNVVTKIQFYALNVNNKKMWMSHDMNLKFLKPAINNILKKIHEDPKYISKNNSPMLKAFLQKKGLIITETIDIAEEHQIEFDRIMNENYEQQTVEIINNENIIMNNNNNNAQQLQKSIINNTNTIININTLKYQQARLPIKNKTKAKKKIIIKNILIQRELNTK